MKIRHIIALTVTVLTLGILSSCGADGEQMAPSESGHPENTVTAYIVRIDGKAVGYLSEEDGIDRLTEIFTERKLTELSGSGAEVIRVTVNSELDGEQTAVSADSVTTAEEIADSFYGSGGRISFSVTVSERETRYISFETVYTSSSSHYEGTKAVKTKGQQGERELTYEVTYTDGEESERTLISDTVTKKAVNEEILVGTKKSTASTGSYAWPLKSVYITSSYGGRYLSGKYNFHLGVDLRAASGTSVYAADGGKVIHSGWLSTYGYLIKIQHDNGDQTYYAHLSKLSVSVGSRVYKGQLIAKSGATGNVTGAHLHFELRKNGGTVNPVGYLPSLRSVTFMAYSEVPGSCFAGTEACLSRSVPPASSGSTREREAYRALRRPSHAR